MLEKHHVLRAAEKHLLKGKYGQAISQYRQLIDQEGEDPTLLNMLGDMLLKNGEREDALGAFHRASEIYTESGFVTKAIAICKKLRSLQPGDAETSEKLADLYLRQGLDRQAILLLQEAVDQHQEWGRLDDALGGLKRLLDLEETPPARRLMAVLHLQKEDTDEAAGHFNRAAELYRQLGQLEDADQCQAEASRLGLDSAEEQGAPARDDVTDAESPAAVEKSGQLQSSTVPVIEASADAASLSDQSPVANRAESLTPEVLDNGRSDDETVENLLLDNSGAEASASQVAPESAEFDAGGDDGLELVGNAATTWDLVEDDEEAIGPAATDPWEGPVDDGLEEADFYIKLGLHQEARTLLARLMQSFPSDERVLGRATKVHLPIPELPKDAPPPSGEDEGADPFEHEVDLALDSLFEGNGSSDVTDVLRYDVARDEDVRDENDPKVHYDLGLAYKEMGLVDDSIEKFRHAYDLFEDSENAPQRVLCCSMLANAFLQLEQLGEAVRWARLGLELPGMREFEWKALQYDSSLALEKLGEVEQALTGYRSISEKDLDYRDIGVRIDSLSLQIGHE